MVLTLVERGGPARSFHTDGHSFAFDFRYSNRVALGVDDEARAEKALTGIAGKRLTYRRTHKAQIH
jgi:hypothetical protein